MADQEEVLLTTNSHEETRKFNPFCDAPCGFMVSCHLLLICERRRVMKILSAIFLLLVWSVPSAAQDQTDVKKRYNKSSGVTTIQTAPKRIHGPRVPAGNARLNGFGLSMMTSYTYPGKTPVKPASVTLTFVSTEVSAIFKEKRDLTITADGEVFRLGSMTYQAIPLGFSVDERLTQSLPFDLFMRIAGAGKVHVQLGDDSFDLGQKHLKTWRGLAASMAGR
jgi:hypothetical protein